MQPAKRHRVLIHVDRHNQLPDDVSPTETRELLQEGLIKGSYATGTFRVTTQGVYAAINAGPHIMRPSAGRAAQWTT